MKTGNARFDAFIPVLLSFEAEYNHDGSIRVERDPHDPGGVTKGGIDQRAHPGVNVAALTLDGIEQIYFADWTRLPCDELPRPLGELLMDIVQNGGPGAQWIQEAVGAVADGHIGPKTLQAAADCALSADRLYAAIDHVCDRREARFRSLNGARFFLDGWTARNEALRTWARKNLPEPLLS
jgi:lysozyme family protein